MFTNFHGILSFRFDSLCYYKCVVKWQFFMPRVIMHAIICFSTTKSTKTCFSLIFLQIMILAFQIFKSFYNANVFEIRQKLFISGSRTTKISMPSLKVSRTASLVVSSSAPEDRMPDKLWSHHFPYASLSKEKPVIISRHTVGLLTSKGLCCATTATVFFICFSRLFSISYFQWSIHLKCYDAELCISP